MKIAMLRVSRTIRGAETYMLALAKALSDRAHEVVVVTRAGSPLVEMAEARGLRAVGLRIAGDLNIAAPSRLAAFLGEEAFDVVHAHGTHGVLGACLGAHRAGLRAVVTFHTPIVGEGEESRNSIGAKLLGRWGRPSLACADHVIAVSECSKRYLVARGFAAERISAVPNGIEVERYGGGARASLRLALGLSADDFVFGFLGALIADKQPLRVLDAFAALPDASCHLVMVGDGALRPACEERIAGLGLQDCVHLLGFRDDIPDVLAALDCLVAPSVREGMPMTFLEAMAAGLPIIATPVGGVPELVLDDSGTLLRTATMAALTEAMQQYVGDAALRDRHGNTARQRVSDEFTLSLNAERVERILLGHAR